MIAAACSDRSRPRTGRKAARRIRLVCCHAPLTALLFPVVRYGNRFRMIHQALRAVGAAWSVSAREFTPDHRCLVFPRFALLQRTQRFRPQTIAWVEAEQRRDLRYWEVLGTLGQRAATRAIDLRSLRW
ncbi:hypothetical protein GCM10011608_21400 [Micromonospora sonchi]|uniref:Uncharacterized protein n=1 Tax=Micromonospora sonchi TaxID=1763543 RepID=A0A917WWM1_9ACTN|nr:hypothetical protein GCM10011608_21400 [Micromonospora sonchi]